MQFGLSESQQILKTNARKFFAAECPPAEVRRIMATPTAHDAALWDKMAEQGFTGITCPEQFCGLGLGIVELALLLEEMGRALVPGPFFSTVVVCGNLIEQAGTLDQKRAWLAPICDGEMRAAFASIDAPGSASQVSGSSLSAEKALVPDAAEAGVFVVECGGALYIVGKEHARITLTPSMDLTRRLYTVRFEDAPCDKLPGAYRRALDIATLGVAAELAGGMQRVLDQTVEYAKTRKQFGKPIGQYQAVQHQCADMFLWMESTRSAVYYAAWALETRAPDASLAASIAKMYAGDAARECGNRGIQVHGGMGFTWENDLHLYYRRFKWAETAFGDSTHHRERIASMIMDSATAPLTASTR